MIYKSNSHSFRTIFGKWIRGSKSVQKIPPSITFSTDLTQKIALKRRQRWMNKTWDSIQSKSPQWSIVWVSQISKSETSEWLSVLSFKGHFGPSFWYLSMYLDTKDLNSARQAEEWHIFRKIKEFLNFQANLKVPWKLRNS